MDVWLVVALKDLEVWDKPVVLPTFEGHRFEEKDWRWGWPLMFSERYVEHVAW